MNKKELNALVREAVQKRLGHSFQCEINEIVKSGVAKQALVIQRGNDMVCPIIYLDAVYERFLAGATANEVVNEIAAHCRHNRSDLHTAVQGINDYSFANSRLIIKVINCEKNREFLTRTPHIQIEGLDLAGIFYLVLKNDGRELAGATVTRELMEAWGKSPEELLAAAEKNMELFYPLAATPIETIMEKLAKDNSMWGDMVRAQMHSTPDGLQLYVLCDAETSMMGASAFLMRKSLHDLATERDSNLIIFPSSIHELILLPETGILWEREEFYRMVRDVNQMFVSDKEFLSDHVYYYDRFTKEITYY